MVGKTSTRSDIFFDVFQSPLGMLFLVFSGKKLAGIAFEGERPSYQRGKAPDSFRKELGDYFEGRLREFRQSVFFTEGTDFEKRVWLTLREVPYGETRTYKWLAEKTGNPKAVRAVGRALGSNPVPIVVPCHRIIGSDGSLVGYTGGIDIKRRLLDMEYYYLAAGK
ncbi:MAG: methylated-DNA--[protein]-cysteine S-methyltransferase [Nitrospirae bacterium]|nr:methylated-DNA--[protein]-cysteine S-methyltransferase [Nitrospirota bacterium]